MAWKPAVDLTLLQHNNRQVTVIDGTKILFIWHNEQVHAVQSQCPHFKLPLAKGKINEKDELVCPFHKSAFDLNSGAVKCWAPWPAAISPLLGKLSKPKELQIYPTKIQDGQVFVDL